MEIPLRPQDEGAHPPGWDGTARGPVLGRHGVDTAKQSYSINTKDVKLWAEIGVIFLLFAIGLEFSFKKIIKIGGSSIINRMNKRVITLDHGKVIGDMVGSYLEGVTEE